MDVRFIGHCTFLIETAKGKRLLTDPWFAPRGLLRYEAPASTAKDIGHIDYVLVSHNHIDHLDRAGLGLARRCEATVVGSERVAKRARRARCRHVVGLRPGEEYSDPTIRVIATHAQHPLTGIFGDARPIGFVVEVDDFRLYFSGDTRLHAALLEQLRSVGPIDIAFLQIAAGWYLRYDGMRTSTAAELAREIRPGVTIPMHYHNRLKGADPQALAEALAPDALKARVFAVGEQHHFERGSL